MTQIAGWAHNIIQSPDDYDELHVHGVRSDEGDDDVAVHIDDEHPQFFSVYARLKDGTDECIGDFDSAEIARQYAQQVAAEYGRGWKVEDYTHGE